MRTRRPKRERIGRSRSAPRAALRAMQRAYSIAVERAIRSWFRAHSRLVEDAAQTAPKVRGLVQQAMRSIETSVQEDVGKIERITGKRAAGGAKLLRDFRARNVALIKTVDEQTKARLDATLKKFGNLHVEALTKKLLEVANVSRSRARFWAVDQTLKLNADIVEAKHRSLGIEAYDWRTSRDGTVRPTHAALEGKRFRYDDPPETGTGKHNPGKDYWCRCHADPVIPDVAVKKKLKPAPKPRVQLPAFPKPQPAIVAQPLPTPTAAAQKTVKQAQSAAQKAQQKAARIKAAPKKQQPALEKTAQKAAKKAEKKIRIARGAVADYQQAIALRQISEVQRNAVRSFTGSGYTLIRKIQRGVTVVESQAVESARRQGAALERMLERPTFQGQVYRGVGVPSSLGEKWLAANEFDWQGQTTSTSTSIDVAFRFARTYGRGPERMRIIFDVRNGVGVPLEDINSVTGEREVLQAGTTRFRRAGPNRAVIDEFGNQHIVIPLEQIE